MTFVDLVSKLTGPIEERDKQGKKLVDEYLNNYPSLGSIYGMKSVPNNDIPALIAHLHSLAEALDQAYLAVKHYTCAGCLDNTGQCYQYSACRDREKLDALAKKLEGE